MEGAKNFVDGFSGLRNPELLKTTNKYCASLITGGLCDLGYYYGNDECLFKPNFLQINGPFIVHIKF